jgi:hypothetical protein
MGPMTAQTTTAVMAVAATSLVLAACGADGGSGGGKSDREKFQEYALKQAECMRRHGIDMPDPKPDGGLLMDNRDVNPEEFERAQRACERELGKPPIPELSEEEQREFREAALKFARCMRSHGVDMPDPTFGANGEVRIEIGPDGRGMDPEDDAAFRAAEAQCRKYQRGPGSETEGSGG